MHRFHFPGLALVAIFIAFAAPLRPQNAAPQAYSYTLDPAPNPLGTSTVKLARDGAKIAVDQFFAVGPDGSKNFHNHVLYDLQAHKIYTQIASDPSVPCTVMTYTSPNVPSEFDVIASIDSSIADLLAHATLLRKETVNGIPSKVLEANSGQEKVTVWLAEPEGFPVKIVMTAPDSTATTLLEMKQLSFARQPASAFAPPASCTAVQGEATVNGVHAQFGSPTH
jgi:hypothetical protein